MINCIRYVIANSLLYHSRGKDVVDEIARPSTKVDYYNKQSKLCNYNNKVNFATTTFVSRNDTGFIT